MRRTLVSLLSLVLVAASSHGMVTNGDFEQALSVGWTASVSGNSASASRGNFDADPDYELYLTRSQLSDSASLSQTVPALGGDKVTYTCKLIGEDGWIYGSAWAECAFEFLNSQTTLLGSVVFISRQDATPGSSSTKRYLTVPDENWHSYAWTISTVVTQYLTGVNPDAIQLLRIRPRAYGSGLGATAYLYLDDVTCGPVVTSASANVVSAQASVAHPGFVDVAYTLQVSPSAAASLALQASTDGGVTWPYSAQAGTYAGDLGPSVQPGSRSISWNAAAQLPGAYYHNLRVRVIGTAGALPIEARSEPFALDVLGVQGNLRVAGRILHAVTRQAVAGATIALAGQSVMSQADGSFVLNNVALASGVTLTVSLSGFATHTAVVSPQQGTDQCVLKDIYLVPASGTKPVVTSLQPEYDVLFIAGVTLSNAYTASVDWRGKAPSQVKFTWNSITGTQVRYVAATGALVGLTLDVGHEFEGSFGRSNRTITAEAQNVENAWSDPFSVGVDVIPLPVLLTGTEPIPFVEWTQRKIEWRVQIPPDIPDKTVALIPVVDKLWPDFTIETSFEYAPFDGTWEWFGGVSLDETLRRRGRPAEHTHLYPYIGAGPIKVEVSAGLAASGVATQTRGIEIEKVGVTGGVDVKATIAQILLSDWIPVLQVLRILDGLKPFGVDPNSVQRVILYATFQADVQLMVNLDPLAFEPAAIELKLGPEVAYEPDIVVLKGRIYVGGRCIAELSGMPLPMPTSVGGEIYGGIEFQAFGVYIVQEKLLFAHGTIWEAPPAAPSMAGRFVLGAGPDTTWVQVPVRVSPRKTIPRNYLSAGAEGSAIASPMAKSASVLAADGSRLSREDAFRLMKQSSAPAASGGRAKAKESVAAPLLFQAELPVITNAFPYSEPSLAGYGQELMLVWVADNGITNDLQYTDIHWCRFDGANWSAPAAIATDTRAEFAPKVAYDGDGDAVAVWQRVKNTNFTNATLAAMAAEMEIVWARWDRSSGAWSAPVALTTNTCYDGSPLLAGPMTDGDVLVAWTHNEANLLMGTGIVGNAANDSVLCARWSAATAAWGPSETVASNISYRISQSFAGVSNRAAYVWTADADGAVTNGTDQEIYGCFWQNGVWGGVAQLTDDLHVDQTVRTAMSPDGTRSALCWRRDGDIVWADLTAVSNTAADTAASYSSWTTTDNGGVGFGPWDIYAEGSGVAFIGSSASNGTGSASGSIDTGGRSWGMRSTNGVIDAWRMFSRPLVPGDVARFAIDNGWIQDGRSIGVSLYSLSLEERWYFGFTGGSQHYFELHHPDTTVDWTDSGLVLELAIADTNAYVLAIRSTDGTLLASYAGPFSGEGPIGFIRFWNWEAGNEPGSNYDFYFNDLSVTSGRLGYDYPRIARAGSGTAGFADYAMTYGPQGNMVLLWQDMTTNGSDAHYAVYDPKSDSWSQDAVFFADAPLERSFAPVWDSAGLLNFAYNKVQIVVTNELVDLEGGGSIVVSNVPTQGRVDVAVAVRRLISDVAILPGDFTVEGDNDLPGSALTLAARLRNVGDLAVSNVPVAFYDGNPAAGGTLITNLAWSAWLTGASTEAVVSASWIVPEPATNRTLYAVANANHTMTEFTENNNTQTVALGGVDLSVSLLQRSAETNGSMRIVAQVQNLGAPSAPGSLLALHRQGEAGAPLATVSVASLDPGRLAQVALDVPAGTQPEGDAFYALAVDEAGVVGDVETNNNTVTFAVNLWLDDDGDGMPNAWEVAHDLDAHDASDAAGDTDHDGMSNYAEWRAGTDPGDPKSYLFVEGGAFPSGISTGGFQLVWGSVSNTLYTLSRAAALENGQGFAPLARHILATPPVNTYRDAVPSTNAGPRFYRIEVE